MHVKRFRVLYKFTEYSAMQISPRAQADWLIIVRHLKGLKWIIKGAHELRGYSAITHEADKFEFEIIVPTTRSQYENNKLSNISSTSFLFDFGFGIQNQKVRLAW